MANYFPIIVDSTSNVFKELPSGDNLDLTGSQIVNSGNITSVGTISANFFVGNGSQLTEIIATTANSLANGTSNVNIPAASGNVNISSAGNSNMVVVTGTGLFVSGDIIQTSSNAFIQTTYSPSLTATGTVQSNAYAITATNNQFTTVPSGAGARLPADVSGATIFVANDSANALLVYPPVSGVIDQATANTPISVSAGGMWQGVSVGSNVWTSVSPDTLGTANQILATQGNGVVTLSLSPTLTTSGTINVANSTAATSSTTGALIVGGGAGIAGNIYVGANANITGNVLVGNLSGTAIQGFLQPTAGTTATPPIDLMVGNLTTSSVAGAIEYDGNALYGTENTTSGRGELGVFQQFRYTSNGSAIGPAIADFFSANTSANLEATSIYEIYAQVWYLKTTAGNIAYTWTFANSVNMVSSFYEQSAVTGFTTTVTTTAPITGFAAQQTTTALTHAATANLTTAVFHHATFRVHVYSGANPTNIRLRVTQGGGTVTPQTGSYYTVRKIAANAGNFAA